MTERMIQVGVARADIILCAAIRWAVIAALCMVILTAAVWAAREIVEQRDIIDYDRPGVDITSEGP